MRSVVFDIETVQIRPGSFDADNMEMTICCTYDSATDSYDSFLKEDLPRLWQLFEQADAVVGYNSDHFDIPVLNKYYPGDLAKIRSIDLMKDIQISLGRRIKLDLVAEGTLSAKKSGHGSQAGVWWRKGDIESLRKYCLKDVELTKRLFDYMLANGSVKYKELGKMHEIKVDTAHWLAQEARPLTFTLGF
mgnify:FL=1